MENKTCQDRLEVARMTYGINMNPHPQPDKSTVCGNRNYRPQWKQQNYYYSPSNTEF